MESLSPIVLLLVSVPEASLVALLGLSILDIRPSKTQVLLIGLIQAIISGFIHFLPIPFGFHSLLQLVTFPVVIYYVVTISLKTSFLVALIGFIIFGLVEGMVAPMLFAVTGLSMAEVSSSSWLPLVFFAPEAVILVLLMLLVRRFNDKISKAVGLVIKPGPSGVPISYKSFPLVGLFLVQSLLIVILFLSSYVAVGSGKYRFSEDFFEVSILYVTVIIMLAAVMVASIKRVFTLIQDETKARAELDSLRRVEELVNTIRAQRHDFSNHLQVSYGLLKVGAYEEAKKYIARNVAEITKTLDLVKTDNLGVTALLFTKTGLAEAKGIDFDIKVESKLDPLPMESRDINIIIGNLIDNAFEAVADLPVDQRRVEASLARDTEALVFKIENSGSPIKQALLPDIFSPDVSTKGQGRGMGLYSVKKLVEANKGTVTAANEKERVVFTVRIPLRS